MFKWIGKLFNPSDKSGGEVGSPIKSPAGIPAENAEELKNRGNSHLANGELAEAAACYRQAIAIDPGYAEAHNNLGAVFSQQERTDEALACFQTARSLKPDLAQAHVNCGDAFRSKGQIDNALAAFRAALALNPDMPELHNNMGILLQEQGKLDEALDSLKKAITLNPGFAGAYINLGLVLQDRGELDEAEACYRKALSLNPAGDEITRYNLAVLLLARGQLAQGWEHYESRFSRIGGTYKRDFPQPEWKGQNLAGKTLLIWGEQGIGDEIMFANLFAETISRARHCLIECAPKLLPLFTRSFPGAQVVPRSDPPHPATRQAFDFQCAAGELARWLRPTLESFPRHEGYLTPDPERVACWKGRLAHLGPGLKIGFCWRSSLISGARHLHYTRLDQWGPILTVPEVHFVNLQYDKCDAELAAAQQRFGVPLHAFTEVDLFNDIDEAAALTQALDLVISAPTTAGALAAALNVPTWMMSYGNSWNAHGATYHPWFPAMGLYPRRWDQRWEEIIAAMAQRLRGDASQESPPASRPLARGEAATHV